MAFLNNFEAQKKSKVNVLERVEFKRSPQFGKFLAILKDRELPNHEDENFYNDLQALGPRRGSSAQSSAENDS